METVDFDLRLTREEFASLSKSIRAIIFERLEDSDSFRQTSEGRKSQVWQQYLMSALSEAVNILEAKKPRTARKRHQQLKEIQAFLGHYPDESDIREILSKDADPLESLVRAIADDVESLKREPPATRRRSSFEVFMEKFEKSKARRSSGKKRAKRKTVKKRGS